MRRYVTFYVYFPTCFPIYQVLFSNGRYLDSCVVEVDLLCFSKVFLATFLSYFCLFVLHFIFGVLCLTLRITFAYF
jgi:hypothetical protein